MGLGADPLPLVQALFPVALISAKLAEISFLP
jgi:hypothetical protein